MGCYIVIDLLGRGFTKIEDVDSFESINEGHDCIPVSVVQSYSDPLVSRLVHQRSIGLNRASRIYGVFEVVLCTRPVPSSLGKFRFPSYEIQVEVIVDAIKVSTRSSVEFRRGTLTRKYFSLETVEYGLLR